MRCTHEQFLADASSWMRKAEAAEEALEVMGENGEVRMICSCPGLKSNVIRRARPRDAVVKYFRYRTDRPLPKTWGGAFGAPLIGAKTGDYIVWSNGSRWEALTEKEFERRYVDLDDYDLEGALDDAET